MKFDIHLTFWFSAFVLLLSDNEVTSQNEDPNFSNNLELVLPKSYSNLRIPSTRRRPQGQPRPTIASGAIRPDFSGSPGAPGQTGPAGQLMPGPPGPAGHAHAGAGYGHGGTGGGGPGYRPR